MKRPRKEETQDSGIPEKVSKMAIGVEGGFSSDIKKDEYDEVSQIVIVPSHQAISIGINFIYFKNKLSLLDYEWVFLTFSIVDDQEVPLAIQMSAKAVLQAESAIHKAEIECAAGTWDGEKIEVSKYAKDLKQLDNGVKIPPKNWKCAECDLTNNLWLNLTDGSILCGRKFFDGSGGNNHAIEHYNKVGYPLAVKLGINI